MKKILKIVFIGIAVLFLMLQFYPRAPKNNTGVSDFQISTVHRVPAHVEKILKNSCYDCHSNTTNYPWYAMIQPVSWWLNDHITEGKKELNFSEFANYNLSKQYRKLDEIKEEVKENKMPLESYTIIHGGAKLSPEEKNLLATWTELLRDSMELKYPLDSLIRKKK